MKKLVIVLSLFFFHTSTAQISDFKSTNFTQADHIAKRNKGANIDNIPLLAYKLTNTLPTRVEKFRAIYTWVSNNIKADLRLNNKITRKREKLKNDNATYLKWNKKHIKTAFKKLIKQKKTICTGYAYLIKQLCFFADIECKIVNGYGRSPSTNVEKLDLANHSWNAVKLNNKWYLCDATWSSGYFNSTTFINDYNTGYFLTDPVLFAKNHYPLHKKWLLNNKLNHDNFINTPIVYGTTFKHKIIPLTPKKLKTTINTNHTPTFSFKTLKTINPNQISLIHYIGTTAFPFKTQPIKIENGTVSFTPIFKQKGNYDIHLKIDNDIVASYAIKIITK